MKNPKVVFFALSTCIAISTGAFAQKAQHGAPDFIESLTEPGEGLAVKSVSAQTGFATFASGTAHGILLTVPAGTTAEERAITFVRSYGHAFGLEDASEVRTMRAGQRDGIGIEHVRLQQVIQGVPIRGAEFLVHMKGARVMAANGHAIRDFPGSVVPTLSAEAARAETRQLLAKRHLDVPATATYSEPRLEVLNRTLISGSGNDRSHLAWFIEVSDLALREFVWIDAHSGAALLRFSQLTEAKNRTVYNANHLSGILPGSLVRTEGGPATGDTDEDNAYFFAGITYDYYLTNHGRDSYDNAGGELRSSAHYCENPYCPVFQNAFWNGTQMVYGDTFASADDVVAHELTHAVTERTANLFYYQQPGALNESFSDIFGETVDLTDGVGTDTPAVRWLLGEDLPIGAIRNMMDPTLFSNPGKMSDSLYFVCSTTGWTDNSQDSGGVHTNSGIPNHAYALMVDGGNYNGKSITGIGLTKAAAIEYRALTVYLTSGANFIDDYNALNRSCSDLTGTLGITSGDCTQVLSALDAVEMAAAWSCAGAVQAPPKCPSGTVYLTTTEGFESSLGNYTPVNSAIGTWGRINNWASTGIYSVYGNDPNNISDHKLAMTNAVTVPTGGRLYFSHGFEFDNDIFGTYDGGVVEYSTNGGTTWNDAGALIDAGQNYNGTIDHNYGNPLGSRQGFVNASFGYTATRLDLSSLAGQNVQFRFRIGSDNSIASLGWAIDNVAIYRCAAATPFTDDPIVPGVTPVKAVHITELRNRINANRLARGLSQFGFADPMSAGSTIVKASQIVELRSALADAYAAAGLPVPTFLSYTDPALTTGFTIKAVHINELRSFLLPVESTP